MRIRVHTYGTNHSCVAESLHNIALLLVNQGENYYEEAESDYREAIAIKIGVHGVKHLSVASSMHQLSVLCYITGRVAESKDLIATALDIKKGLLGANHVDYVALRSHAHAMNMGTLLDDTIPLYEGSIESTSLQSLGQEHDISFHDGAFDAM